MVEFFTPIYKGPEHPTKKLLPFLSTSLSAPYGAVLIIYIPYFALRASYFIYIIRIREIIIYRKCVFFFAYLYTGDGGRQKMLHFFTTFSGSSRAENVLFFVYFLCNKFLKIITKNKHKPQKFINLTATYYLTERTICGII